MRKRKNDKPILVYSYWAQPLGDLPDEFWRCAREMNRTWNQMVNLSAACELKRAEVEAALRSHPGLADEATIRAFRYLWKVQASQLPLLWVRRKESLPWGCREALENRFKVAGQEITKKQRDYFVRQAQGTLRKGERKPELRFKHGLESINIPHRFTGGGKEVDRLFTDRQTTKSISLRSSQDLTRGVFGVGNNQFRFEVLFHRPLPDGAICKGVNWVGRWHRVLGWEWSLNFTLEIEPVLLPARLIRRVAGLDLGWRRMDDDTLRIGMVASALGHEELLLSLKTLSNGRMCRQRRLIQRAQAQGKSAPDFGNIVATLQDLKRKGDEALEIVKQNLRPLLEAIGGYAAILKAWDRMRDSGLRRLRQTLQRQEQWTIAESEALTLLQDWSDANDENQRLHYVKQREFIRRRTWEYYQIAHDLCGRFDAIVWEGDLSLKQLAEAEGQQPALKNAQEYRSYASLYQFRQILVRVAQKKGTVLVAAKAEYTTREHFGCGGTLEKSAALHLTCERCGARTDQDINAAQNLLAKYSLASSG